MLVEFVVSCMFCCTLYVNIHVVFRATVISIPNMEHCDCADFLGDSITLVVTCMSRSVHVTKKMQITKNEIIYINYEKFTWHLQM